MMFVLYSKKSQHSLSLLVVTLLLNMIGCILWCYSMKKGIESSMAITVYAILTTIGCSLLGVLIFKETISIINIIGIGIALIALYLINK